MWAAPSDGSPDGEHERGSLCLPSLSSSSILLLQHSLLILEPSSLDFQRKQKASSCPESFRPSVPRWDCRDIPSRTATLWDSQPLQIEKDAVRLSGPYAICQSTKSFYKLCSFREPWLIHFSTHPLKTFPQWVPLRGLIWYLSPHHEHQKAVTSLSCHVLRRPTHSCWLSKAGPTDHPSLGPTDSRLLRKQKGFSYPWAPGSLGR